MKIGDHIELFEYFYSNLYNKNFEFNPSKGQLTTIQKFIDKFNNPSIGKEWLFKYYAFQFSYWMELKYRKYNGVHISYILGKKAIERFNNRNENWEYFTDEFISNYKLLITKFYKRDFSKLPVLEEIEKNKYLDSNERLANCLAHTTLYNIKSRICVLCSKSKSCKEIQKMKYPNLNRK